MRAVLTDPFGSVISVEVTKASTRIVVPVMRERVEWRGEHEPYERASFENDTYRLVRIDGNTAYYDKDC